MLNLLGFKKKINVGISISTDNIIQLVAIDNSTQSVVSYATGNIKYNNALKEPDINSLADIVNLLFEQAELNPADCNINLSIPNVLFGINPYQASNPILEVEDDLKSEAEDMYIFNNGKKNPFIKLSIVSSPNDQSSKHIVYGILQEETIRSILEIFDENSFYISRIETKTSSMIRGLKYCERFSKFTDKDTSSVILNITQSTCTSLFLKGGILSEINEQPLAIKSFSEEEIYSIIAKIASDTISKNKPKSLLIISEADEVNAAAIVEALNFDGTVDYLNKSTQSNDELININPNSNIDVNLLSFLTISAIGTAVDKYTDDGLNLNFLPNERINPYLIYQGSYEINLIRYFLAILIIVAIITGIIVGIFKIIMNSQISSINKDKESADESINVFRQNLEKNSRSKANIFPVLQEISNRNKDILTVYNTLSSEIPEDIYIKRFVTNGMGGIGILGESKNSDSVKNFIQSIREKDNKMMLSKLAINEPGMPDVSIPTGVTFEIKTSDVDVQFQGDILEQFNSSQDNNNNKPSQPPVI